VERKSYIRCHKLEELLAAKLKCLIQRRHSFDLYDYVYSVFINHDLEVNRTEILRTFLKKTIFEPSPAVAKALLLDLPLETFRAVWHKYLVCPAQNLFDFDTAISRFRENVEAMFAGIRMDRYGQIAFYPSHFRNIIMEAANDLTVLDITYDGRRRQIEPYSLVFKRRKDGFGQEYLYAYDRTGGRTSGPGLKSFLHPKIQALTTTEERFEPRLPVELGKAGEFTSKTYFGGVSEQVFHPGPACGRAPRGCTWWNVPIVVSDSHKNATTPDYVHTKISTVTIATGGPVTSPIRDIRKSVLPSLSPDQDRSSKTPTSALLHARMRSLVRAKAP
jgi:hypothetical protein